MDASPTPTTSSTWTPPSLERCGTAFDAGQTGTGWKDDCARSPRVPSAPVSTSPGTPPRVRSVDTGFGHPTSFEAPDASSCRVPIAARRRPIDASSSTVLARTAHVVPSVAASPASHPFRARHPLEQVDLVRRIGRPEDGPGRAATRPQRWLVQLKLRRGGNSPRPRPTGQFTARRVDRLYGSRLIWTPAHRTGIGQPADHGSRLRSRNTDGARLRRRRVRARWWPRRLASADPAGRSDSLGHDRPTERLQVFMDRDCTALVQRCLDSDPTIQGDRDVGDVGKICGDASVEIGPFAGDDVKESRLYSSFLTAPADRANDAGPAARHRPRSFREGAARPRRPRS